MALLNTGCLVSTIQADVTGLTTGSPVECFVILAAGLDSAISDRCVTVPTSGSLPSLWPTQTVPQGQVMFVEDVGVPVIAASGKWIGFDQRVFRRDQPLLQGELFTWGYNLYGALGDGTTTSRSSPGTVAGGGTTWCLVKNTIATAPHVSAIKADGSLWTWGNNGFGKLGDGTTTNRSSPGTTAGGGNTWCAASTGAINGGGIKTDGTLWTWGGNAQGRLGDGTTTSRSSPGTTAGGGTNWCAISFSTYYVSAIKTDGTLWTWGNNGLGTLGDGSTTDRSSPGTTAGGGSTWCAVSSGGRHTMAIKTDGTLWTWGSNFQGALGDGTTTTRSSPGTVAGGGNTWCAVSAGGYFSAAIKTDGTLWTWGRNGYGNLGDGTTTARCSPGTAAGGGTTWCSVSSGWYHTSAIKTDGTLWTWGSNFYGALGSGFSGAGTSRSSPGTTAGGGTTWKAVSSGYGGTAAFK